MKKGETEKTLRRKAEKVLLDNPGNPSPDYSDTLKLIHELEVHEIELKLQNEELALAKEKAEAAAEKYTLLYDFSPSGYFTLTKEGKIVELNLSGARILGKERSYIVNTDFDLYVSSAQRLIFQGFLRKLFEKRTSHSCEITLANRMVLQLAGISEGDFCRLTAADISSLRKTELENEKLLASLTSARKKLDIALENASIGLWELDIKSGKMTWDDIMMKICGVKAGEFKSSLESFYSHIYEEDIPRVRAAMTKAVKGESDFEITFRIFQADRKLRYISSKASIRLDNSGPGILTGVCIDITKISESSRQALINLNRELMRSNDELRNFAYIASHDLQEPLRMVTSFAQLLELQYRDKLDDKAHEYIGYLVEGSKRMYDLLNGLLSYSRIQTKGQAFENVDMNQVLGKVLDNLRLVIEEKKVTIRHDELPVIHADGNQMIQLFQNLIENSIKFSYAAPVIHISAVTRDEYHVFSVKDNGIGIDRAYFERIFRIFQRLNTREEYKGTGIGLAICKSIVERHGGQIWVESVPEDGACFFFKIPVLIN